MTITVINPTNADAGVDFEVCVDTGVILLTGSPANGSWSGNGINPNGTYNVNIDGSFDFTYTFGTGNCLTTDLVNIIVNPLPIVDAGNDQNFCVDAGIQNLLGSPINGSWSGTVINLNGDFDPANAGVGSHAVYYSFVDSNTCENIDSAIITVNALPIVDAGNDTTLCNQPGNVSLFASPLNGIWSGLHISSSGDFNPSGIGSFENIYTYTDSNGCVNSDSMTITVINPTNADAGVDFEVCVDTGVILLTGSPANGSWSGNGINPNGTYNVNIDGSFDFTYTFGTGNCLTTDLVNIIVNPLPLVDAGIDQSFCIDAGIQSIVGSPSNGTWSGIAINANGDFDPASAGVGSHTVYYSFVDSNTCENIDSANITVNALPIVDAGNDTTLCNQPLPVILTGTPSNGTWSGQSVSSSGQYTPFSIGSFELIYQFIDNNGCYNDDTVSIIVIDPINADAGQDFEVCLDTGLIQFVGTPLNGFWSGNNINTNGDYLVNSSGSFDFTYNFGAGNCLTTDIVTLLVNPLPLVDAGIDQSFCISDSNTNLIANPNGGNWNNSIYIDSLTGLFSPSFSGVGVFNFIYEYTDSLTYCSSTDSVVVTVNPLPISDFICDTIICLNTNTYFNNQSSNNFINYWKISDGYNSNSVNLNHIFLDTGFYEAKLITESLSGCLDSVSRLIHVISPPTAYLNVIDSGCGPLLVNFNNYSDGYYLNYDWNFGNGQISQNQHPSPIIYNQSIYHDTIYYISLIVNNLCGFDSISDSIIVRPVPTSIFSTDLDVKCTPDPFNFIETSFGNPVNYFWDFGDGTFSSSSDSVFQHVYYTGQYDTTYTISLTTTNECGSDTSYHTITVLPNTVHAFFNTSNNNGCVPLQVDFSQFSTTNTFYSWDFGDGNFSSQYSPVHVFNTPGTYNVHLYVNDGCSYDTISQIINVDSLPQIDIQVSDSILCTNDIFYFFNNSQNTSIIWDFDDGNSSFLTNPLHSFSNAGNYNVKITVTSLINGCVNNDSLMLTSLINPEINLDFSDSIGCPPLNVQFINNSSNADYYSWDFDDGNFANFQSGNHNYTNSGVYNGTFIATSINGCLDSLNFLITVHPTPTSRFNLNSSDVCYPPATAYFTNNSISANSYFWNFGNGDSSQLTSPISIFSVGTFNIELIAQNIFGCEDFSDTSFVVYNTPISSFNLFNDSICLRDSFAFESTSLFYDSLLWDLDNGFYSNDSAFKYLFLDTGLYNITLYAYNKVGNCIDTSLGNNYIYVKNSPNSDFYFTNNISPIYPRSGTIEFYNNSLFSDYYLWNFDFLDSSSLENPIYNYSYNNDGFYGYTLYSYSENGCVDSLRKEIYISYEKGLFVPNAFCPTHINNELNKFKPRATGLREYHIEIFDLYGNKLWESRDLENSEPKEAWDGTFNGVLLMQDVYVWKISALFKDDVVWEGIKYNDKNILKKTGTVTLIR